MFRRWCLAGAGLVLGVGPGLFAQMDGEAEALLARAHVLCADVAGLEATAHVRELRIAPDGNDPSAAGRMVASVYQRVVLTRGLPDDWRIISQRERDLGGRLVQERTLAFGKRGAGDGVMWVLNPQTKAPESSPLPLVLFRQEVTERLGAFAREDALFAAMFVNRGETGADAFGLENAVVAGRENTGGLALVRIQATRGSRAVVLWLDEDLGWMMRALETAAAANGARQIRETVYSYDFARGRGAEDFDLEAGWALARPGIAAAAKFGDAAGLIASTAAGGDAAGQGGAAAEPELPVFGPSLRSSPGAGEAAAVPAAAAEAQLLSSEQMESIVMVEGDGGVGTGFVARLRGVDFVVTNLHVIGGNEKITVTTVRGVSVPVSGMFGAMGRDIAILRIEGENTVPALKLTEDPIRSVKLGDKVAVVGNRRGGGVATQVSGTVRGMGPNRVEVDAPFQPGNSGSPILHVETGEVVGVASYSQRRELDELDGPAAAQEADSKEKKTEQRWFGFRIDGVEGWETIDLERWRDQAKRIAEFEEDSEAIYYAMYGRFREASRNPRIRPLVERFEERYNRMGTSPIATGQVVQEFFHGLRSVAASGVKELNSGDYYNFFRTSEYWETSIPEQLRARADLTRRLERATDNTAAFLARVRR